MALGWAKKWAAKPGRDPSKNTLILWDSPCCGNLRLCPSSLSSHPAVIHAVKVGKSPRGHGSFTSRCHRAQHGAATGAVWSLPPRQHLAPTLLPGTDAVQLPSAHPALPEDGARCRAPQGHPRPTAAAGAAWAAPIHGLHRSLQTLCASPALPAPSRSLLRATSTRYHSWLQLGKVRSVNNSGLRVLRNVANQGRKGAEPHRDLDGAESQ